MSRREMLIELRKGALTTAEALAKLRALQPEIHFPLSEGQKGLWTLHKLSINRADYNLPLCFEIDGFLNLEIFWQACNFLPLQHSILKSVIRGEGELPFHAVTGTVEPKLSHEDISGRQDNEVLSLIRSKIDEPFVLNEGPLWRVNVFSKSPGEHVVLIVVHHIVFDGVSVSLLLDTLVKAYDALTRGEPLIPRARRTTYRDFVEWEQSMILSSEGAKHRSYWLQQLSGELPTIEIPSDRLRSLNATSRGCILTRSLPANLAGQIGSSSRSLSVTPAVLFLGIYHLLLHRYTGERDIIVGMPTVGRPQRRFDELIGNFVNMIALRKQIADQQSFADWIKALQSTVLDGLDHAVYPFPCVVRDLRVPRGLGRPPIFQVAYEYQNASVFAPRDLQSQVQSGLQLKYVDGFRQVGEYELVLEVAEQAAGFTFHVKYDANLFSESAIARMVDHYVNLLSQVLEKPTQSLSSYTLMTPEESNRQFAEWNATESEYPSDRGIHELIKEQAQRTSEAVAVKCEEELLTYRELDERSDQLAVLLARHGVQPGDRVGLCVERSISLPIGLLGILKAGAAYVPLDPAYPRERLGYMLQDSGARCVVIQSLLLDLLGDLIGESIQVVCVDRDIVNKDSLFENDPLSGPNASCAPVAAEINKLAYVMYTSGSTGLPKGVMITHKSLVNFLVSMARAPGLAARDRVLAVTTYSFDIAGLELYLPLLVGAECHICSTANTKDAELLRREIARVRPTLMQATPTTWSMLLQVGWQNEEHVRMLCGGEALPQILRQRIVSAGWEAWNLYGPTETTIWSTLEKIVDMEGNSIGKPIANTQVFIIDQYQQPTPILVPGELCIAGDGLALGYFNRPSLTMEKFIEHPFEPGSKLYKTGDVAYWRPDGMIEYVGRIDAQVKIRGYRVELGEIESRLAKHPRIQSCAVVAYEKEEHKYLAACFVLMSSNEVGDQGTQPAATARVLREYLKETLPDYMIPSRFVAVEALPLTPNGKVDRQKLAKRVVAEESATREKIQQAEATLPRFDFALRSDIERRLQRLWQQALSTEEASIDEGFFDAGGDSVLAVTVAAQIKKEFGCAFSVTEIFRFGTIRKITDCLLEVQSVRAAISAMPGIVRPAKTPQSLVGVAQEIERAVQGGSIPEYYQTSVAIIGLSCQFPGAQDHREFWSNLVSATESIQVLSPQALRDAGVPESMFGQSNYVPVQAAISGKEFFDADFFKVSPRDAELMDPQLRLLLQHAWKAVEDAGYIAKEIPDTSVLIASSNNDYAVRVMASQAYGSEMRDDGGQYVSWLLAQSGTIPTMISHRLGFKGPSLAVHSNCSSSLVAANAAYRNLLTGETKQALVGAAAVFATDNLGYLYQKGMNFSSDGHVRTFDASADGMIGGEGVAVVLLKRVPDAIADGDHIYALIRGIAVNNDGADKVGFYAPSVDGQARVIAKVLESTQIDPRTISYVEAHGTGTELGDPIELAAISMAYRQHTDARQFCGIGSVKTNIGHLDTAAGLAGLIKITLGLVHRELPPTLHYRTPNPKLALEESPFYVVDRRMPWHQERGPRRAALSSFGIGGTNAHLIVEEYLEAERASLAVTSGRPALIVLSAKNEERLQERAKQLLAYVEAGHVQEVDLINLAYTLQVGREAMEHRLAFRVTMVTDLKKKLAGYVDGSIARGEIDECYLGHEKREKGTLSLFAADEELQEAVSKWVQRGKYNKVMELWVNGLSFDWNVLYGEASLYGQFKPRRLSLPTYPFAKQRYWMEASAGDRRVAGAPSPVVLHPLLQNNTSDLNGQRFSSWFSGEEFFLADHVVKSNKVLPGVCYLEMARAAVAASAIDKEDRERTSILLRDVVWIRPVIVDTRKEVHIGLSAAAGGEIEFEIYTEQDAANEAREIVHAQGRAVLVATDSSEGAEQLDLSALRSGCDLVMDASQCYAAFGAVGIEYGPAHRGLTSVESGKDTAGRNFVLAQVKLPECVSETQNQYVLHPSVLDCALQASIGFSLESLAQSSDEAAKLTLPFALDELEIWDRSPREAWVLLRSSDDDSARGIRKLDIDICDEAGRVCVRLAGFSSRVVEGSFKTTTVPATYEVIHTRDESAREALESETGGVWLAPRWEATMPQWVTLWPSSENNVVLAGGTQTQQRVWRECFPRAHVLELNGATVEEITKCISEVGRVDQIVWLAPLDTADSITDDVLIAAQATGVLQLYRLTKALLALGYGARDLGISVVTWQTQSIQDERIDPTHASVHGLVGSLAKEYEHWKIRLVDLPGESEEPSARLLTQQVLRLPADPHGNAWVYRSGEWYRQQLVLCEPPSSQTQSYRQGGVYVVIGGAGGLGEVLSEYLIRNYRAQMIWIGRRELDADIQAKVDRLSTLGPVPTYLCADATDRDALARAHESIVAQHGKIHGVVHAAIALLDKSLAQMDEDRFTASLAAKVAVSVRMAQVFAQEQLDFVLFFSSLQSFSKAAGQSNYAAGCTFKDAFAQQLAKVWSCPVKVMNWSYWGGAGVVASDTYRARMAQQGIGSIESEEGMAALEQLLGGNVPQLAFMKVVRPQELSEAASVQERIASAKEHAPAVIGDLSPCTQRVLSIEDAAFDPHAANNLEELMGLVLFHQLQGMGLFSAAQLSLASLRRQLDIPALYDRWLEESVRVLMERGYVAVANDRYTVSDLVALNDAKASSKAVWAEWDEQKTGWDKDPNLRAQVRMVDATLRALPAILTGKKLATDVLFPNASMELLEGVYKHNKVADFFNAVLVDTVVEFVEARLKLDAGARLRILEIGAGTGGTSAGVFERLKPYESCIAEYCYTDISKAFLMHAEEVYGPTTPYLATRLFNVEQAVKRQGIEIGAYDLVIASNVLHATKNIRRTLRNAKATLKRHGLLVLNEITDRNLYSHLTFGLLEGWWLYEDDAVRIPATPALASETWQRVLASEGFENVLFPAATAHPFGQQIIVASSDGSIRQPVSVDAIKPATVARKAIVSHVEEVRRKADSGLRMQAAAAGGKSTPAARDENHLDRETDKLRKLAIAALKKLVSEVLKTPIQQLDENEPLETYGFDSILVVKLTNGLREFFPDVSSTMFFEHRAIAAAVDYLVRSNPAVIAQWVGSQGSDATPAGITAADRGNRSHSERSVVAAASKVQQTRVGRRARRASSNGPAQEYADARAQHGFRSQGIAVIGMSGRYPQARNINEFWVNLKTGKNCIAEIPKDRWDHAEYFDPEKGTPGKSYSKWGGFIEGVDKFDPLFFQISPIAAGYMDPQERLFLQEAYASIEDAGYTPNTLCASKKVGVYAGVMNSTYAKNPCYWSIANRVSYVFDFQGPSMAVDTACSSSLTAIHLALESIRSGACEVAIAGGVNVIIDPVQYTNLSLLMMLSSDDRCRSFGDQADGFVDGEGVGTVVLKSLEQAIEGHDHIYGVIKASAVNAGGRTNGYTVPSPTAQRDLIDATLRMANIDPRTISYVEAHGTGTSLGDPIEVTGLTKAFESASANGILESKQFCALGSAKSNIGHLESAAGIAGITKVLLQMQHKTLAPSLHSSVLNPHIDFAKTPFVVQQELAEWKRPIIEADGVRKEYPRIAGVSSFGAGGANAHLIVEEYIESERETLGITAERPALIVLSARNEERLKEKVKQLLLHLERVGYPDHELGDLAYTLQVGREPMEQRLAFTAVTMEELTQKLHGYVEGKAQSGELAEVYCGELKKSRETLSVFNADSAFQQTIEAWIAQGRFSKLLELWAKGLSIEWTRLYGEESGYGAIKPRRISLPAYPYAQERYWVKSVDLAQPTIPEAKGQANESPSREDTSSEKSGNAVMSKRGPRIALRAVESAAGVKTAIAAINVVGKRPRSSEQPPRTAKRSDTEPQSTVTLDSIERELTVELAKTLYMDVTQIDRDKPFVELGLDSIVGVEWMRAINKRFGLSLKTTRLYDYPMIKRLAVLVAQEYESSDVARSATQESSMPSDRAAIPHSAEAVEFVDMTEDEVSEVASLVLSELRQDVEVDAESQSTVTLDSIERELTVSLAKTLYMDVTQIDRDKPFVELGLDSIVGVEWMRAINKRYGLSLKTTRLYDYPMIKRLAVLVAQEYESSDVARPATQVSPLPSDVVAVSQSADAIELVDMAEDDVSEVTSYSPIVLSELNQEVQADRAHPARRPDEKVPTPRSTVSSNTRPDGIAVIGMSGRYPMARDLAEYWENLASGRDCVTEIPPSRWDVNEYYDPRPQQTGKVYCKWLGQVEDIEYFDPLFFAISPAEAAGMDPQHRLFLEESYRAFEDAGYNPKQLSNVQCGVYLGIMSNEYGMLQYRHGAGIGDSMGNSASIGAARIAYYLNLKGPAIPIDTACSSSLVATHLACQALRNEEIELALVGGVTLYLVPETYIGMCVMGMLSPQGRCKTFDNSADGFVPGEGVGTLVLKRLKDAEAAQDRIYGVIIGTGINQDGKTNGITAPSALSQMDLAASIYARYDIHPESVSYVEMHGTGTKLGDPIELDALATVFKKRTTKENYCALGSVKSNIGHVSAAAGVASVQKVLLAMKHRELVPTIHYKVPNEHFDFAHSPFYVNTERRPWEATANQPRRAAVSSLGYSGTNAHAVIEEYVPRVDHGKGGNAKLRGPVMVVLSAKSAAQLKEQAQRLLAHIHKEAYADSDLLDIAYTLQVGREALEQRLAFTAGTVSELQGKLRSYVERHTATHASSSIHTAYGCYVGEVKRNKEALAVFVADDDMAAHIEAWIAKGKYSKLLELWAMGLSFDWQSLYGKSSTYRAVTPKRISLPTYPFARERYWIDAAVVANDLREAATGASIQRSEVVSRSAHVLKKGWRISPMSEIGTAPASASSVIIVCRPETQGLADRLAQRFAKSRVHVMEGEPASVSIERDVEWTGAVGWIDIVGCGSSRVHDCEWITSLQQWIELGAQHGSGRTAFALCVTRGVEAIENADINLSGADRVGLYRMLSSEYGRLRSRHVDVDPASDEGQWIEQIVAECGGSGKESEVCYRHGMRYEAVLEEVAADQDKTEDAAAAHENFPSEQVVWITGGTRGLGYACAEHLVRELGVKRLVLTGREEFPPREQWHVLQAEDTAMAKKIRAVLALESAGAEVQVLSVSLTDDAALKSSVAAIKKQWGAIGGVIHCAGGVDRVNPAFVRKSVTSIESVLSPKVSGLDRLVDCMAEEPLRFFLLFSSVSAIVPNLAVGNSDYAMANAYMDYVAQAYSEKLPIVSIQWPNWKETGMGEIGSTVYRQLGFLSHSTAEGLRFLDRVLLGKVGAVVLPAMVDNTLWRPDRLMQSAVLETARSSAALGAGKRSVLGQGKGISGAGDSSTAVQSWLVSIVARELKMDSSRIEIDTPLPDYGVDSVLMVQLLRPISERVGQSLDPSILFEHPTIEGLSQWLMSMYGEVLASELANSKGTSTDSATYTGERALSDNSVLRALPLPLHNAMQRSNAHVAGDGADIAVVGLSCRFPGAVNLEEYWRLLSEGRSAIGRVPRARWGEESRYYAGVLDQATQFDPAFFLISQADARAMDPQALMVLEESLTLWHQAGYTSEAIKGRSIGVYLGARSQHLPNETALTAALNPIMATGANYLAANISRFFDLCGPSMVVDTACSSALVAMSMAMNSLRSGEIESALVGGASLLAGDHALRMFEQRGILNQAGAFHLFDRRAQGAILGEGVGMVWLKTVEQALRDGDSIYAVIKAVAVNNDGRTASPTAPNFHAHKAVMQSALAKSGKRAEEIDYVEVNGSGTEVTDLLELKAIEAVYRATSQTPCELGSMKPNIGHPLCAEGIASFIKSVLMLHHGRRVPFLSAQEPMRHYDFAASPFRFTRSDASPGPAPNVVAINSFADGGTNAHVIVEAWREREPRAVLHTAIAPPRLHRVECGTSTLTQRRETAAVLRPARRKGPTQVPAEQRTELQIGSIWGRFMTVDIEMGTHAQEFTAASNEVARLTEMSANSVWERLDHFPALETVDMQESNKVEQ